MTVDYAINPGTATTPADYAANDSLEGSLSFAPGETSKTVTVNIVDDAIDELDETFTIDLSNAANATISDSQGRGHHPGQRPCHRPPPPPPPTVAGNDVTVNEGDGTLTFTLTRSGATGAAGSVDYAINPGTATTPADYTANDSLSGTVNFAAGETSKTVTVNIVDDAIDEANETFTIDLSGASGMTIADAQGVGTILDNDAAPSLSVDDVTVNEEDGTLTFTVSKSGATASTVTVDYAINPGHGDHPGGLRGQRQPGGQPELRAGARPARR